MMTDRPGEITLVFHSDKDTDRKMRDYMEGIDAFQVNSIDLRTENLTEEDLSDLADKLDVDILDLFDPVFTGQQRIGSLKDIPKETALKLLAHDPMLLSTPIVVIGEHAYQFESSSELIIERRNEA